VENAKSRLVTKKGFDLTVGEIHGDYVKQAGIARYPLCQFQRHLPKVLAELFGVVRAHDIGRPNGNRITERRGFNGLAFQDSSDDPDGADRLVEAGGPSFKSMSHVHKDPNPDGISCVRTNS
jgi:hypothetical protein